MLAIIMVPTDGTTVTMGATLMGTTTWSFGIDLLGVLDVFKGQIDGYAPGTATSEKDLDDGYYLQASMTTPMSRLSVDTSTGLLGSTQSIGGVTMTVPAQRKLSSGGALTVSDLDIDFTGKRVYANLIGANGVGRLDHFYLWDFSYEFSYAESNTFQSELVGLKITADGFNAVKRSLGLLDIGTPPLRILNYYSYGTINTTIVATPAVLAVPEPATLAYLMCGLAIIGLSLRRRAK